MKKTIKVIELFENIYQGKNIPKKIEFVEEIYERTFEEGDIVPIPFLYRNINDREDFLFRDYGIDMQDVLTIVTTKNREIKKVRCIETNKVFKSPATAGWRYDIKGMPTRKRKCKRIAF